ncbi:Protein kinase [Penicillium alfredii]|uniref:cyclin-dependent kinase n=1 Tax=Penicillium alfredii TaxID=1506179 RepID=A0A9W9FQX8_9EURO|nr:Protein kinase [Penicillium alfredii]KAJ5104674.1 Protein kinase [Penicillium alfredii]
MTIETDLAPCEMNFHPTACDLSTPIASHIDDRLFRILTTDHTPCRLGTGHQALTRDRLNRILPTIIIPTKMNGMILQITPRLTMAGLPNEVAILDIEAIIQSKALAVGSLDLAPLLITMGPHIAEGVILATSSGLRLGLADAADNTVPIMGTIMSPWGGESENYFRAASRDPQREDDQANRGLEGADSQTMPPPGRESDTATPANKSGKFSFTLKSKATPLPSPKPVPDLAQRMQIRQPPPRAPEPPAPRNRLTNGPLPQFKPDSRSDRRDRDRGRNRDRGDRRDFRGSRDFREPRGRRDDRRFDQRRDRRKDDRRPDFRRELPREPSPERPIEPPPKQKKILSRPKQRPILSEEFAKADSVYYRKPGNESVIGAGTYGKVFKAIHVYTQRKVALKKIRMEGEKDGYPVTAVREIKLLQHLRHHNVVSLLEVMVEDNECFMVFEYLSHDLTGLINHPSFSLTLAHKKDLAKQMFEGLYYLHHRGVLHRDIKAANILVSNRGLLKFADFGLARFFSKSRQLDYTNRVITICAACVCMEMFTKKAVFPGEGGELSQLDKLYNSLGTPTRSEWPDLVEMPWFHLMRPTERKKRVFEDQYRDLLTPAALDLISQVFHYDPAKRPSAEDVLQHPYFVSEEPAPQAATELENIQGDWHEFESKALRKEARRVEYQNQRDREKRKAEAPAPAGDRDLKRAKQETSGQALGA